MSATFQEIKIIGILVLFKKFEILIEMSNEIYGINDNNSKVSMVVSLKIYETYSTIEAKHRR